MRIASATMRSDVVMDDVGGAEGTSILGEHKARAERGCIRVRPHLVEPARTVRETGGIGGSDFGYDRGFVDGRREVGRERDEGDDGQVKGDQQAGQDTPLCKCGAVAHRAMKLESAQKSALRSVTALLGPAADDPVATRSCMAFLARADSVPIESQRGSIPSF